MKRMPAQAELDRRYVVAPVLKAMRVIRLVCEAPQLLSLNDRAVLAALPKTTAFRYLRSFLAMRMVDTMPRPTAIAWVGPVVAFARRPQIPRASSPNLPSDLEAPSRSAFNETANLGGVVGQRGLSGHC
jgi:hypothetical protein